MSSPSRSWIALLAAVALHGGAVVLALWAPSAPKTEELVLPTVQGILLPAPPAEVVQAPKPPEPVPPPPEPEKPKPKPKTPPKPKPPIEQPPSERAISQPEEAVETPPPVQTAALPMDEAKENLAAPITPPVDANHLDNPRPAYPNLSRRLGEKGTVLLEILILADGTVGEVRIKQSSGYKRLDDTAVKAVKRWRYTPAKRGGEAIDYWYLQPVDFSLN